MFAQNKITFNNSDTIPFNVPHMSLTEFGTLSLTMPKTPMTQSAQVINMMIDESGSMDDMCEDGKSKMDQIKHVVKNILDFIIKECHAAKVQIGLQSFNTRVRQIFDVMTVTEENVEELHRKIKKIIPTEGTNIEDALGALRRVSSSATVTNIFMSDGDANDGEREYEKLAKMVDSRATNYFIGFGLEHNPNLFAALASRERSHYYFVDKIEKSGLIYGEILYNIMYKKYDSVKLEIMCKDGQAYLYDHMTDQWRTEIIIGNMSGEMKKTIHILASTKENVQIKVTGYDVITNAEVEETIMWNGDVENLMRLIYRQRTMMIIHKSKMIDAQREKMELDIQDMNETNKEEVEKVKKELKELLTEMNDYMKKNEMMDDRIMKSLCDDVVVIYRTIGTTHGFMYSCSRQTSQGAQRLTSNSNTPMSAKPYKPSRQTSNRLFSGDDEAYATVYGFDPTRAQDNMDDLIENYVVTPNQIIEWSITQTNVLNSISKTDEETKE